MLPLTQVSHARQIFVIDLYQLKINLLLVSSGKLIGSGYQCD